MNWTTFQFVVWKAVERAPAVVAVVVDISAGVAVVPVKGAVAQAAAAAVPGQGRAQRVLFSM
jgi:hypothetical protein